MAVNSVIGEFAGVAFYGFDKVVGAVGEGIHRRQNHQRIMLGNINEPVTAGPSLVQTGEGYALKEAAKTIAPMEGYTDVVVHGSPNSFDVWHNNKWESINQRSLATFLKNSGHTAKCESIFHVLFVRGKERQKI